MSSDRKEQLVLPGLGRSGRERTAIVMLTMISPEYSLERLMLKLKLQYVSHLR